MKLKPLSCLLLMLSLSGMLYSCKEFIEPSISKRQVRLEAPADSFQSTKYTVNFWWDEVEDAIGYRLQIVTPGFDKADGLIMDTLVKGDKFTVTLDPGQYQWRLRAENGSSQTAYSEARNFTVTESSITNQNVILSAPVNNTLTNQQSLTFRWGTLFGATRYRIEIDTNNFVNESSIVFDQTIPGQQISFIIPKDQVYAWRVRAENETEQAKWSAVNYFTRDATPPAQVKPDGPANNASVSQPVNLKWGSVAGAAKYKLFVFKGDSSTVYNSSFPMSLNTSSYSFNIGSQGQTVYWKVSAIDAAGNEGKASELRSFTLQ